MPWVPDGAVGWAGGVTGAVGWAGGVTGAVGWAGGVTGAVGLAGFTGLTGVMGLAGTDVEVGAPLVAGAVLEWPCHRASASATKVTATAVPMTRVQMRNQDGPVGC